MNRMLSKEELSTFTPEFWLSKQEKLKRLAKVVREYPVPCLMVHNLEQASEQQMKDWNPPVDTALYIAAHDQILMDAGVNPNGSGYDTVQFLELTHAELHPFSCDCNGLLTNAEMASYMEVIAIAA